MNLARMLGAAAVMGLCAPAFVRAQIGQAELAAQDLQFAEEAAIGGLKEVTLGELAQQQAKDEQVVQFGQRVIQDHGQTNEKLMASRSSRCFPHPPGELVAGIVRGVFSKELRSRSRLRDAASRSARPVNGALQ